MSEQVDVLLATFQGARFLEEQLESILTQSHPSLHLFVRDDGSSDQTVPILKKWMEIYPHKITFLSFDKHLGIQGNFSELMKVSTAPYVMFADQDDKWLRNKVEITLNQLKALERQYGSHLPLLVHTDLKVVDQNLNEIAPSFWTYSGLNPDQASLNRVLSQNITTGCTALMNRTLVDLASPIPSTAIMHDWWIALVAACFGHIEFVDQQTILYRQHQSNDTGARKYGLLSFLQQTVKEKKRKSNCLRQTYQQAQSLLDQYKEQLPDEKRALLQAYVNMENLPCFEKLHQMMKFQFFKQGFLRNAKMLFTK